MENIFVAMEGHGIELEDRRNHTLNRLLNVKKPEDDDNSSDEGYISEIFHNYSFRHSRPRPLCNEKQNKLNIKQLELPLAPPVVNNCEGGTKKSKKRRYLNKLGLKPLKLLTKNKTEKCEKVKDEEIKFFEEQIYSENKTMANEVNYDINNINFDFDVLRLIMSDQQYQECNHNDDRNQNLTYNSNHINVRETHQQRNRNENHQKIVDCKPSNTTNVGKNKKIRFTLSKPQSPRTVQVIRVDVTTSACGAQNQQQVQQNGGGRTTRARNKPKHDVNNEDNEDEDDYCGRFRRDYGLAKVHDDHKCKQCTHCTQFGRNHTQCKCNYCAKCCFDCHQSRRPKLQQEIDVDFALMCKKLTLSSKD